MPSIAHAGKRSSGRAAGRGAQKMPAATGKVRAGKGQKEILNIMETVAFPHEQVEAPKLVVAKVPTATELQAMQPPPPPVAAPGTPHRVAARAVRGGRRGAGLKRELAPNDMPETPPPPLPAAPKAAPPPPTASRPAPDFAKGETGKSIDAMLAKAMVPTAAAAEHTKPAEAPIATTATTLEPGQITQVMKPVNKEVRTSCPFGERGVVMMRIEVGAGGQVAAVTPEGPLAERPATSCLIAAVKRARIPASPGVSFRYPFAVR